MVSKDTKSELLDAAQELIQRVGVKGMSYQDLRQEVGIQKASIHYHFPKKEDLVEALILRCGRDYGDCYRSVASSEKSVMSKLEDLAGIFENSLKQGKVCTAGMLSVEIATLSERLREVLQDTIRGSVSLIESIFIQGVADRTFPKSLDTAEAAMAYHDFLLGTQIMARCLESPEHFQRGVRAQLRLLSGL
jgi:TetR/AcrR family transcriptional repressor of nem operon